MAYTPLEWVDGKAGDTPLSADNLNRIEDGIQEALVAPLTVEDLTAGNGAVAGTITAEDFKAAVEALILSNS